MMVVAYRSVRRIPVWSGRTVQVGRLETTVVRLSHSLFVRLQPCLRDGRSYVQQRVCDERGRVQEPRATARRLQRRVFVVGRCLSRDRTSHAHTTTPLEIGINCTLCRFEIKTNETVHRPTIWRYSIGVNDLGRLGTKISYSPRRFLALK